jgi:uncharacterized protein
MLLNISCWWGAGPYGVLLIMIPLFPQFKPISIEDQLDVTSILKRFPPYSDFNFANLFCYNTDNAIRLSTLYGNLVVRMPDYLEQKPFFTFIGQQRVVATIEQLLHRSIDEGLQPCLRLLPGLLVESVYPALRNRFEVEDSRDDYDYIHTIQHLTELDGPQLHAKRKNILKLRRQFPDLEIREIDLRESPIADSIRSLYGVWRKKKGCQGDEYHAEQMAIERCLEYAGHFEFVTLGVYLHESLVGFTINEPIHDGYYMGHFGKSDPDLTGCSDVLEFETAKVMRKKGCLRLNNQQDLGIPGLRRYKRSWNPNGFLTKYSVSGLLGYY